MGGRVVLRPKGNGDGLLKPDAFLPRPQDPPVVGRRYGAMKGDRKRSSVAGQKRMKNLLRQEMEEQMSV